MGMATIGTRSLYLIPSGLFLVNTTGSKTTLYARSSAIPDVSFGINIASP